MSKRLTLAEIRKLYPDQWVGLEDVEFEPDNRSTIKSAVVKYTDKTKTELTRMQIQSHGEIIAKYTGIDNTYPLGFRVTLF